MLLFLPFLFYTKEYFKWGVFAAVALACYSIFAMVNPVQKANWADYFKSVKVHTANHQLLSPKQAAVPYNPIPILNFEGISIESGRDTVRILELTKQAENSNLFIFYNELTKKKLSIFAMTVAGIIGGGLLLLPLFFLLKRKQKMPIEGLFILGFLVYNVFEFCTPVTRLSYHWVQFLFPLLLFATQAKKQQIWLWAILALGFTLEILPHTPIKMQHNLGEGLVVLALLYWVYHPFFVKRESKMSTLKLES